jgi:hypothetical protein
MKAKGTETKIVLQVGSELRVNNKGDIIIDNPELELAREPEAADATIAYRFEPEQGVHVFRLLNPVADHKHMRTHHSDD